MEQRKLAKDLIAELITYIDFAPQHFLLAPHEVFKGCTFIKSSKTLPLSNLKPLQFKPIRGQRFQAGA